YLSHTHPENRNGSDHLLSDTFIGQDTDSPDIKEVQPGSQSAPLPTSSKRRLSVERSLSSEDQHHQRCAESSLKPARVYTITRERNMLGSQGSKESLELEVLKRTTDPPITNHHYSHPPLTQPLQSSGSAHNIRDWGSRRSRSREDCMPDCVDCIRPHCQSQRSLDLETSPHGGGKQHKKLERMYSEDRVSYEDREDHTNSWFPKENMFSFQTATTTMQAAFRGIAERKRRKREQEATALMERNFRKHLRMVGSRRVKVQSADLQASSGNLEEEDCDDVDWEEERELERAACEGDDFIPPKIMLISSKVPKAEYVPNIIIRDDPSIIPILYDHEHATFDDILEEIEKKLTAYRKGCKIWNMLIFCQGGPGHLYLLKNKVATFAKVEKEEDMIQFWKRLGRFMSLLNPEPNLIHIMGCYVLGNANGEKLFQNLKRLMKPHVIEFKSPLELSAQGKEMIEMYFDFRLYRLWKSRQHSKLLDYDDLL
uniref:NMDA receptor synaptonuclear signaling and neuronal migration factor b n=1 Tax=Cyprinus carpio TaxID=7962 RepID=A0A8C1K9S3_CYPCA